MSTEQNPQYTFAGSGVFQVCLTVGNDAGFDQSCQTVNVVLAPEAAFSFSDQGDGTVAFTDESANDPATWQWDFGDGNTSNAQNPTHTYEQSGDYEVSLIASNSAGSDTARQTVSVLISPTADFTFQNLGEGMVAFTDQSTGDPTAWNWDFGDGSTSMEQNPTHTYEAGGVFTVCLTASNAAGADTTCMTVRVALRPMADFTFQDQGGGTFAFTDESTNNPILWVWEFGDGESSTEQNPVHTYDLAGDYEVCLAAGNDAGFDTTCMVVNVALPPTAAFTFEEVEAGTFAFSDQSTNNPTSWLWDFGDGNTSMEQNPEHTYEQNGEYTICLTASNATGSDSACATLTVLLTPEAAFTVEDMGNGQFAFTDQSTNDPTSWLWDFGDGSTSTEQNPQHTFQGSGDFTVCLTATNAAGSDSSCTELSVVISSVDDLDGEGRLVLFPNPGRDVVTISLQEYFGEPLNLRITNHLGQVYHRAVIRETEEVPVADWAAGPYFYTLTSAEGKIMASGRLLVVD